MAESLFPVFDMPDLQEEEEPVVRYQPSVFFDFEKGDFALDGAHRMAKADGKDAFMQWCLKVVETEREACLAYSEDIGTEIEELPGSGSWEEIENEIEETITDALMVHKCTEHVSDFQFEHTADSIVVSFVVKGYDMEEELLSASLNVK